MSDWKCFMESLINGNMEGVSNNISGAFVNKMVEKGKLPIHIACEKGFLSIVQLLIDHNCNIECKDDVGMRPIHYTSINGHADIVRLLINHNCNIECEDERKYRPIHYASSNGHADIVKLLMDHNCDIECENKWQMRSIHYACRNGNVDIVRLLTAQNCNIDCEDERQMRPIHLASISGHVEIIKSLILNKSQIDYKDRYGQTALDLAKECNHVGCVELLSNGAKLLKFFAAIRRNDPIEFEDLYKSCNYIAQNFYTGFCFLEILFENNADRIIKNIINKPINDKEINDFMTEMNRNNVRNANLMKQCMLYRCVIYKHVEGFKKFKTAEVINGNCGMMWPSFLELAAEKGCGIFIDEIMKKTIYDKSIWQNAMIKAKEKGFHEIEEEISDRMILLESRQKVNFTILHSGICDNDPDIVKYILDHPNVVDINCNNETFGTALALAHSLHHSKCIKAMQKHQLETNTQNKYLQTALHEAISSGVEDNCQYLIDKAIDIDQIGFMGLTGLHSAVIRGMRNVSTNLVIKGADYVRYVELSAQASVNEIAIPFTKSLISLSHMENALTLSMKFHATLWPCFLERLNSSNSNVLDGNGNSLLHMAVKCLQPDLCRKLINAGAQVNSINNLGMSPLIAMFSEIEININDEKLNKMIDITNILTESGADVNAKSANEISAFQSASIIGSEKLMLALVSNNPHLSNFSPQDFQLPFMNHWFEYGERLIRLLPDNFLSSNITNETFQSLDKAESKLIKLLFDKSSSEFQQSILERLLRKAADNDGIEIFDHLIQIEISQPNEIENEETLLTVLMKENKIEYAWKLLDSINKLKFVNLRNRRNQTPLQVAIEMEEFDLIDHIIPESEGLDNEDDDGRTALTELLEKISICTNANSKRKLMSNIRTIISLGGDINMVTSRGRRILDACTDRNIKADVEEFYRKRLTKLNMEKERSLCNICMDNVVNIALQCGHLLCGNCSDQLFVCPLCNAEIISRMQLYFN